MRSVLWLLLCLSTTLPPAPGQSSGTFGARFNDIKRHATREQLYAFLFALPKGGDLHNHAELSVPPEDDFRTLLSQDLLDIRLDQNTVAKKHLRASRHTSILRVRRMITANGDLSAER